MTLSTTVFHLTNMLERAEREAENATERAKKRGAAPHWAALAEQLQAEAHALDVAIRALVDLP